MFRGALSLSLDSKGRLAIPTRYRDHLLNECLGQLICTIDIHQPCLLLYPLPQWEFIEQKLAGLSSMVPEERRIQRLLLGHAAECEMDSAGRILLPATLRSYAQLHKELMLVGQLNKFEIWDADAWQQQIQLDIQAEQTGPSVLSARLQDLFL
ncbi:division/cell wall cluster transcriptional repressor MraZ [Plesiomonas shigelloides subsp. oncorhynchi]|jgi:MraZ protein|uniref:Transcriptional regulator MraZ n=2 Tax=Plesiomonas shigelloides TaxID=703 RepID=R8AT78_PLESH|nr:MULTISPECIES: division/cell wall cluster transcriptional repressor MraZ [Plesiomonas]MDO4688868.1 division/cell wall cluster transcriptional repressor MraZ [Plesiomonas sp.]EON89537.1 cell division protein MraZ [Plesiomonas shigelloides 302-73]KAB7656871.1 division/cell wall cluster transcriptional repressor MraZ [Plesiomonas shigelloides]KAB7663537.1 division/cell wall cluster transcriptional repressor MraZ [Plesiomonas shigelloides]KAB7664052.1 division/cell wall cluster transcriptional r